MNPTPVGPRRIQVPTLLTGLLVGALVAGALVPLVGSDVVTTTAGTPSVFDTGSNGVAAGAGGASAGGAGTAGAGGQSGGGTAGSGGAPVPGSGTGTGSPAGGGTAAAGDASTGTGGGPVELTASDIGVTPDTIHLGSLILNCQGCAAFGVTVEPVSNEEIMRVLVDDLNARGGINGRRVELHTADFDPVRDGVDGGGTQRAGCIELTERDQVFAVVQGGTFSNACIYAEHETPLITTAEPSALDPDTFNQSNGRLWTTVASSGRTLTNWARQLVAQGFIGPGTRLGVVTQEFDGQNAVVERYLVSELTRLGVPPTHVSVMPGNPATVPTVAATEVAAMRAKGVDHVLLALDNFVNGPLFLQQAERDGWTPQYYISEFPSGANDGTPAQMPPSFEGAIAISNTPEEASPRTNPAIRRCLDVWERHTGEETPQSGIGGILYYCVPLRIFELAATNAGPNLTRESFVQALAALGPVEMPGFVGNQGIFGGAYGFGPVKWSGASFTNTKVWTVPCPRPEDNDGRCWVETTTGTPMDV